MLVGGEHFRATSLRVHELTQPDDARVNATAARIITPRRSSRDILTRSAIVQTPLGRCTHAFDLVHAIVSRIVIGVDALNHPRVKVMNVVERPRVAHGPEFPRRWQFHNSIKMPKDWRVKVVTLRPRHARFVFGVEPVELCQRILHLDGAFCCTLPRFGALRLPPFDG